MKVILITPGTGSYYCGVCMRDNALAKELIRQGHDAVMLPMYLPLTLDEAPVSSDAPIFYGGINVYLQQKFAFFRHTPRWLDRLLNSRTLLRKVAQQSGMTAARDRRTHPLDAHGRGRQAGERTRDARRVAAHPWQTRCDLALHSPARRPCAPDQGSAADPVICSLQGEDAFLDGLAEPWRARCWAALAERSRDVDRFIAPSRYFADLMQPRMALTDAQVRIIPNGVSLDEFVTSREEPATPVIGFLARMIEGKGIAKVVEAFILLKKRGHFPEAKLRCAGAVTREDERYVAKLQQRLADAGCAADAEFLPNVSREEKTAFSAR
jgi:glycosyltransferase involved in cell wall biosynthesis